MESGVVSFVNLTQKPTSCTLHAYMQERIQVVKPNAELYTRQYSSFSQTLQFSLPPRIANFAQLWGLNFIYLKMKKVMVFALYFKRKTETMERRWKKRQSKSSLVFSNSEHYRSSWESTQVISEDKISTKNRVHAYIQHFMWGSLTTAQSAQKPYLRYLFQICPGFI